MQNYQLWTLSRKWTTSVMGDFSFKACSLRHIKWFDYNHVNTDDSESSAESNGNIIKYITASMKSWNKTSQKRKEKVFFLLQTILIVQTVLPECFVLE